MPSDCLLKCSSETTKYYTRRPSLGRKEGDGIRNEGENIYIQEMMSWWRPEERTLCSILFVAIKANSPKEETKRWKIKVRLCFAGSRQCFNDMAQDWSILSVAPKGVSR